MFYWHVRGICWLNFCNLRILLSNTDPLTQGQWDSGQWRNVTHSIGDPWGGVYGDMDIYLNKSGRSLGSDHLMCWILFSWLFGITGINQNSLNSISHFALLKVWHWGQQTRGRIFCARFPHLSFHGFELKFIESMPSFPPYVSPAFLADSPGPLFPPGPQLFLRHAMASYGQDLLKNLGWKWWAIPGGCLFRHWDGSNLITVMALNSSKRHLMIYNII